MSTEDKQSNNGINAGNLILATGAGNMAWDACILVGLTVGGPIGGGIGWCVGAGLFALGIVAATQSGSKK
jgi:hypothetical protein